MPRYIDAEKSYERFAELEAQALSQIEKLNGIPFEEMTKEEYVAWRVWSAIYQERSAFKHDIMDAPTADVVERKTGKWIYYPKASGSMSSPVAYLYSVCSMCGREHPIANYCPNCGARMERE